VPEADELEPVYLEFEDILEFYAAIVGGTAGEAQDRLRNRHGLESALARPAAHAHYEGADLAGQAAVLAHGIAEGQPFLDGNKRLALVSMLTFLEVNGYRRPVPDRELADWMISLSAGTTSEELADQIRAAITPQG
jgi:death-on-curing protein